jgi:hypothetical protein
MLRDGSANHPQGTACQAICLARSTCCGTRIIRVVGQDFTLVSKVGNPEPRADPTKSGLNPWRLRLVSRSSGLPNPCRSPSRAQKCPSRDVTLGMGSLGGSAGRSGPPAPPAPPVQAASATVAQSGPVWHPPLRMIVAASQAGSAFIFGRKMSATRRWRWRWR